jgi:hypothetical protein
LRVSIQAQPCYGCAVGSGVSDWMIVNLGLHNEPHGLLVKRISGRRLDGKLSLQ